jgi:ATP-dependent DNA helicase RecQ
MGGAERSVVSEAFASRTVDVVVATNAFGMGIDRADVRLVAHVQPPSSLEAYYQEVGRAGRDGAEAWGLLFCSSGDIALRRRLLDEGTPEQAARQWALFRELLRYLDARSCRHDFILRYFGDERDVLGGCGHCDVCVTLESETPESTVDATLIVQKALSGVARVKRRAGIATVADMLRGHASPKVAKFRFEQLSTFGVLSEFDGSAMLALLRVLLAAGWIDLTPTDYPVPYVTDAGWAVMKGDRPARVVLPRRSSTRIVAGPAPLPSLDPASLSLLDALKAHRATIARGLGYPAYVVAHDRTLVELAKKRPRNIGELLEVRGFGPLRAEQYGDGFLQIIASA